MTDLFVNYRYSGENCEFIEIFIQKTGDVVGRISDGYTDMSEGAALATVKNINAAVAEREKVLRDEIEEQARLLGMSASREAALLAKIARMRRVVEDHEIHETLCVRNTRQQGRPTAGWELGPVGQE